MGVVLVPVLVAIVGAFALIYQSRLNASTQKGTSIDTRAQAILDRAMSWQDETIKELREAHDEDRQTITDLRQRTEALEADVADCEVGRRKDRDRYDRELNDLRREVRQGRPHDL